MRAAREVEQIGGSSFQEMEAKKSCNRLLEPILNKGDLMAFDQTTKAVNAAKRQPRGVIKQVLDGVEAKKKEKETANGKGAEIEVEIVSIGGRRGPKNPSREVQPTLPGTEEGLPKIPSSIKRLLPGHLETILERSRLSKQEADERKTIGDLMIKYEVKKVPLDNGAFLVLQHTEEDKVRYVPAKEAKDGKAKRVEPDDGE